MDYEKKYNEAVKTASYWHENMEGDVCSVLEEIFPELKESEDTDEKVRKALIKLVTNYASMDLFIEYDIHLDEALSWLEKQRDKDKLIQELGEYKVKYTQEVLNQHLEKQGEQKPAIEGTFVNVDEVREDFMQEVYRVLYADPNNDRANKIIDAFDHLPTIIIQNPAGNVKPKFHEGDWIIRNNKYTGIPVRVIKFNGCYLCDLNGEIVTLTLNDVHNNFHLWLKSGVRLN